MDTRIYSHHTEFGHQLISQLILSFLAEQPVV